MKKAIIIVLIIIVVILSALGVLYFTNNKNNIDPGDILTRYFKLIEEENYEELYSMVKLPNDYSKEDFIARNKNIYGGIDAANIQFEIQSIEEEKGTIRVTYINKLNTSAGKVEFTNSVVLSKDENKEYKINWSSNLIFPELNNDYKVRVATDEGKRGRILDRNGKVLAGEGKTANIGIVPGKFNDNKDDNIKKVSELLNVSEESINNSLSQSWVKDDTFVPIKSISDENIDLKNQLLQIQGIMINSESDRVYPYKDVAAHITGYVSSITKEELEKLGDKDYSSNSIIGKTGLEKVYEDRLKETNGTKIYIQDSEGKEIKTIAQTQKKDGEDIKLTIDIDIQQKIYEKLKDVEGLFVVMNPKTGELLALVSTPSYDPNRFVLGMTNDEWNSLLNAPGNPLYTRFTQSFCPGSTMKPITGAIGLTSGKLSVNDEFNYSGLSWQKSTSWKDHKITTLTAYSGKKVLRNALIYSDNIYFAQAVLQIGEETFRKGLDNIKFNEDLGLELSVSKSQYSNSDTIQGEGTLADSGYGQGQLLINPIHMASIYSAFLNDGNMIKPYIEYKENIKAEYLVENAFSKEAANEIKEGLIDVVETPSGTGHDVKVEGITIAGKTGTAELKASKEDTGDTLGWFDCFTVDRSDENSLLIISMAKNQKSAYLKAIIKTLF